jgi:hypothetical protein
MESRFYMTYGRSRPSTLVPWIEDKQVPLLTNAITRWSDARDVFLDMWEYDTEHVIDAGGYNVQATYVTQGGDVTADATDVANELVSAEPFYPYTVDEYHEWLQSHADEFSWATAMDYACEDRFNNLWSVEERIDNTIDNTIKHFELAPDYDVLPVLQGRNADQYIDCLERLNDAGIPTDYVGIGTVCRLSSETKIVELEQELRERTDINMMHGFGVKVNAYKLGAGFETADSQAWVYEAARGKCRTLERTEDGLRMPSRQMRNDSLTRTVHSFKAYYAYVTDLMEGEPAVDVDEIIKTQQDLEFTDERPDNSHIKGHGSV